MQKIVLKMFTEDAKKSMGSYYHHCFLYAVLAINGNDIIMFYDLSVLVLLGRDVTKITNYDHMHAVNMY